MKGDTTACRRSETTTHGDVYLRMQMETRYSSAGRVQPIEFGTMALPGTCLLCNRIGHNPQEIFATLGVELEFYGVAYLCLDCCAEIADFIMFKSPAQYDKVMTTNLELAESNLKLQRQLDEARGLVNARIDRAGSGEPDSNGPSSVAISEAQRIATGINQGSIRRKPVST